jgi:RimJ/RimL family protein N-acetyltransferase
MTKNSSGVFSMRPMGLNDVDAIAVWFENLEDLSLFDRNSPAPMGLEALREYWKSDFAAGTLPQKAYWYIAHGCSGEPAALGGLQEINYFRGDAVLPVFVARQARGRGIGIRMIGMLLDLAFDRLRLTRVTTYHREDNEISARMIRKAAFSEEGRLRKAWHCNGRHLDTVVAGVLREDWAKRREELRDTLDRKTVLRFGTDAGERHAWPGSETVSP